MAPGPSRGDVNEDAPQCNKDMAAAFKALAEECREPSFRRVAKLAGIRSHSVFSEILRGEKFPTEENVVSWVTGNMRYVSCSKKAIKERVAAMLALRSQIMGDEQGTEIAAAVGVEDGAPTVRELLSAKFRDRRRLVLGSSAAAVLVIGTIVAVRVRDTPSSQGALVVVAGITHLDDEGFSTAMDGTYELDEQQQEQLEQPNISADADFLARLREDGGISVEEMTIRLSLHASQPGTRIVNIKPVVHERSQPREGTMFWIPPQAGEPTLQMITDLDQLNPALYEVESDMSTAEPRPGDDYFRSNTIRLDEGDEEVLVIRVLAACDYVGFSLQIDYQVQGRSVESYIVNDVDGKPFELTAYSKAESGAAAYDEMYTFEGDYSLTEIPDPATVDLSYTRPCDRQIRSA